MKTQSRLLSITALVLFGASGSVAATEDQTLAQLAWLSGCWTTEGAESGSGEQWMPLAGDSLLGVSRTVRQGATVAYEFMRIARGPDGKLTFFAQPSGKPPAGFPVLSMTSSKVVFENLAHEFPQRVIYHLQSPTRLHASIEGMRDGSLRIIAYPMVRVDCDAQLRQPANK